MQSGEPFWFDKIIQPILKSSLDSLDLRFLGLKKYHFSSKAGSVRWDDVQVLLEDVKQAARQQNEEIIEEIVRYLHSTCHGDKDEYQPLNPHTSPICIGADYVTLVHMHIGMLS
jgi:hypothetical protein